MLIEINEDVYVNPDKVVGVELRETNNYYGRMLYCYWIFYISGEAKLYSKTFKDRDTAKKWLRTILDVAEDSNE